MKKLRRKKKMKQCNNTLETELIYGNNCPYMDILWRKGIFFLSNAVLRLIKNPSGIRFQWNAAKRSLIIEPTCIDDPDGFPVIGLTYVKSGSLFVGSVTLIHKIWAATGWDKTLRYRTVAKYNQPSNVAIFELKDAVASEIPKNFRGGRPKKTTQITKIADNNLPAI